MQTRTSPSTGPASGDPSLVRVLRGLQQELHAVLSTYGGASSTELTGMIVGVERLAWQVFSVQTLLAAEANHRSTNMHASETLSHEYGCASVYEYLQRATRMSRREAGARIKLGRSLREEISLTGQPLDADFPYVAAAMRAGAISPENAKMITRMLIKVSWLKGDKRELAEKYLVEAATGIDLGTGTLRDIENRGGQADGPNLLADYAEQGLLDPLETPLPQVSSDATNRDEDAGNVETFPALAQDADSLRIMVDTWQQYLDQDGTLLDEKESLNGRYLNFGRPHDGLVPVNGKLDPEVAATFSSLIDAIISPRSQKTQAEENRQKDAGRNLTDEKTADSQPTETGQASDQHLRLSLPDLEGRTPAHKRHDALASIVNMAATSAEVPQHGGAPVTVLVQTTQEALETGGASWVHGPGSDTTLLTSQAVNHAACSGALQYYAKNATGKLVALGTKQRIFNAHQRRAIVARDGGCVIPGCATPPAWCEIHHVHPHSEGGETHTDNGVALCWYHHRTLDTNGWQIRMNSGAPEVRAPRWIDPHQKWRKPKPPTEIPTHQTLSAWSTPSIPPTTTADGPPNGKTSGPRSKDQEIP